MFNRIKQYKTLIGKWFILLTVIYYIYWLPTRLFNDPTSTVLLDQNGSLLGAKIAGDGQWRFEEVDSVPEKFEACILTFEDKNFYTHIGISVKGIIRAIQQNVNRGKIVSGGSTITMQLARIVRKNPPRTFYEKCVEMVFATRLELEYSKKEILNFYVSHAPFGNNVVGIDAAAWRYYGKPIHQLSWAESATLAVLPNAPGLIYPGKNSEKLLRKRNRLLHKLFLAEKIDESELELALTEPLPGKPLPLPQIAPHLLTHLLQTKSVGKTITTSIQEDLQRQITNQVNQYMNMMQENQIYNASAVVTSVKTGEVVAYVGNVNSLYQDISAQVDCANAPRSSGSILKPLLYLKSLEQGIITPNTLLFDVPSHFGGYSPKNFSGSYEGAIPADEALARSLNIPMVHLLQQYNAARFHQDLRKMGFTSLIFSAKHYGLSLILGGAETKLVDLAGVYTNLAQQLNHQAILPLHFNKGTVNPKKALVNNNAAIYATFEAMTDVNRPDEDNNWRQFSSAQKIAWKTGTSFGFRDAWAVGINTDYVVAVWVGNADGEGRPGLTGIKAAAPLLFDIFNGLPRAKKWFTAPIKDMSVKKICQESGQIATPLCQHPIWKMIPKTAIISPACPYHQIIHLNQQTGLQVNSNCESPYNMKHVPWFVLPAHVERFYKMNHPNYKELPPFQLNCIQSEQSDQMSFIYPRKGAVILLPKQFDEKMGEVVCEVSHRNSNVVLFWHLDDEYIGKTKDIHQLSIKPKKGKHYLKVVDEMGNSSHVSFSVVR